MLQVLGSTRKPLLNWDQKGGGECVHLQHRAWEVPDTTKVSGLQEAGAGGGGLQPCLWPGWGGLSAHMPLPGGTWLEAKQSSRLAGS